MKHVFDIASDLEQTPNINDVKEYVEEWNCDICDIETFKVSIEEKGMNAIKDYIQISIAEVFYKHYTDEDYIKEFLTDVMLVYIDKDEMYQASMYINALLKLFTY
jgi:hypothetical protein